MRPIRIADVANHTPFLFKAIKPIGKSDARMYQFTPDKNLDENKPLQMPIKKQQMIVVLLNLGEAHHFIKPYYQIRKLKYLIVCIMKV